MSSKKIIEQKKSADFFDYQTIVGIDFGSKRTKFFTYETKKAINLDSPFPASHPSACLYICENNDYDNAIFVDWGERAEELKETLPNAFFIDKLLHKVEHLYDKKPDLKKASETALDRLYQRAIVQYFKELKNRISRKYDDGHTNESRKIRYVMTYPTNWIPEKATYLRSLVQNAGIINEDDHPDRLILYKEGEAILRYLQEPHNLGSQIEQGHRYLICNLGSKIKMDLYDIKEPLDTADNINSASPCDWISAFGEQPAQFDLGANMIEQAKIYIQSRINTESRRLSLGDIHNKDGSTYDQEEKVNQLIRKILIAVKFLWDETIQENTPYCFKYYSDQVEPTISKKPMYSKHIKQLEQPKLKMLKYSNQPKPIMTEKPIHSKPALKYLEKPKLKMLKRSNQTKSKELNSIQMSTERIYLKLYPREIEEKVIAPIHGGIIQFIEDVMRAASVSIDGIILVGGLSENRHTRKQIADACNRLGADFLDQSKYKSDEFAAGALLKCLDDVGTHTLKPEFGFNDEDLASYMQLSQTKETFIFIDFGLKKTSTSYIHVKPGEPCDSGNIEHITDWPGQSTPSRTFPTLDVLLIPSIEGLQENDGKKIVSLTNEIDYHAQYLKFTTGKYAEYKYHTFERDAQGINIVTHSGSKIERPSNERVEDLQNTRMTLDAYNGDVMEDMTNLPLCPNRTHNAQMCIDGYAITVKRRRISVQEFSLLYFDYLTMFLLDHIKSKIGVEMNRFRFCITRDSQEYPDVFTLSDKDLHEIALKCNMVSVDGSTTLPILERMEATAVYCRRMVNTENIEEGEAYMHFLQVHLHPDRCVLLLNDVPFLDDKDNNINEVNGEAWESIYKYAKTKTTPINVMNNISENLWTYLQKRQQISLKKCGNSSTENRANSSSESREHSTSQKYEFSILEKCKLHKSSKLFFNSKNMGVFKRMLHSYFSSQNLSIAQSELVHKISICDSGQQSCCYINIANMDLLDFCIMPAINQLASIVQTSVSNQDLFQGVQISNIFVLGEFLDCRDYASYRFLEELLLSKIRKIKFRRLDDLVLQSKTKTLIKKIDRHKGHGLDIDSIEYASLSGSVMYGLSPRNRLVERIADRTYVIIVGLFSKIGKLFLEDSLCGPMEVVYDKPILIVSKGTPLVPFTSNEIRNNTFFLQNGKILSLSLYTLDDNYEPSLNSSRYEYLTSLGADDFNPTFPVVFKAQLSQTNTYKFWIEYERDRESPPVFIRERILLKSFYNEK